MRRVTLLAVLLAACAPAGSTDLPAQSGPHPVAVATTVQHSPGEASRPVRHHSNRPVWLAARATIAEHAADALIKWVQTERNKPRLRSQSEPGLAEPSTVSPPPKPPQTHVGIEAVICSVEWDCATALRVARCESQLDPRAVGRAGELGILQIHPVHRGLVAQMGYQWADLHDPTVNVAVAVELWRERGWAPWTCARGK